MNSYDQRFDIWIKQTQNPFIDQNYSKSEIIKNLARTSSLFLIFSENFYKSKTWNIMTELCYERWFTTRKNDKVLIKQAKSQSTYSFAGQKLTTLFSIHFWLKLLFNFFTLQDPQWLLYVHFKSSSSNWMNSSPKSKVFIQKSLSFVLLRLQCHPLGYKAATGLQSSYWVTKQLLGYKAAQLPHSTLITWFVTHDWFLIACIVFMTYQEHNALYFPFVIACTLLNLCYFLLFQVLTGSEFGSLLSPFCFNGFVKLIAFCP